MVENGINKLDQLVKTIKYSKEKRIYEIIDDIENMILFSETTENVQKEYEFDHKALICSRRRDR